jgi:hypothetical protein
VRRERSAWAAAGGAMVVLLVVFAPGQLDRLDNLERTLGIQEKILADLDALPASALRCEPLAVTNRRPIPHLALAHGFIDPADVRIGPPACTYVGPSSEVVAKRFILDRNDEVQAIPDVEGEVVARNDSWVVIRSRDRNTAR